MNGAPWGSSGGGYGSGGTQDSFRTTGSSSGYDSRSGYAGGGAPMSTGYDYGQPAPTQTYDYSAASSAPGGYSAPPASTSYGQQSTGSSGYQDFSQDSFGAPGGGYDRGGAPSRREPPRRAHSDLYSPYDRRPPADSYGSGYGYGGNGGGPSYGGAPSGGYGGGYDAFSPRSRGGGPMRGGPRGGRGGPMRGGFRGRGGYDGGRGGRGFRDGFRGGPGGRGRGRGRGRGAGGDPSTTPCAFFSTSMGCKRGDSCWYIHDKGGSAPPAGDAGNAGSSVPLESAPQ